VRAPRRTRTATSRTRHAPAWPALCAARASGCSCRRAAWRPCQPDMGAVGARRWRLVVSSSRRHLAAVPQCAASCSLLVCERVVWRRLGSRAPLPSCHPLRAPRPPVGATNARNYFTVQLPHTHTTHIDRPAVAHKCFQQLGWPQSRPARPTRPASAATASLTRRQLHQSVARPRSIKAPAASHPYIRTYCRSPHLHHPPPPWENASPHLQHGQVPGRVPCAAGRYRRCQR
jgi:hypothetical protein